MTVTNNTNGLLGARTQTNYSILYVFCQSPLEKGKFVDNIVLLNLSEGSFSMFNPTEPYNDLPFISEIEIISSDELIRLREETRVSLELLNYVIKTLVNPKELIDTLALQEAKVSSKIENIHTTNDDLYKAVMFKNFSSENKAVSDYKDALVKGFELLRKKGRFGIEDLEDINEPINSGGVGIRANLPNFGTITRITKDTENGKEIIYTPPHGKELLTRQLLDMLNYIYDDEQYPEHSLVKIALAHCQFENIHPFKDGNGRTGRILNILFLCQKGYLSFPILYVDDFDLLCLKNLTKDFLKFLTSNSSLKLFITYLS